MFWFAKDNSVILEPDSSIKFIIGLFDGHGGPDASVFTRDNLPKFLQEFFSTRTNNEPTEALREAMIAFDTYLIKSLAAKPGLEKTGTCALYLINLNNRLFVVNIGDSKAIVSHSYGSPVQDLVVIHRPDVESEAARIVKEGGHAYRNHNTVIPQNHGLFQLVNRIQKMPLRVFPGNLSVSRTLGDANIKNTHPGIIISAPYVTELKGDFRYLLLGSDGVFDMLTNNDLSSIVEKVFADGYIQTVEEAVDTAVSLIFQQLIESYCFDNISAVLIAGSELQLGSSQR